MKILIQACIVSDDYVFSLGVDIDSRSDVVINEYQDA